jgi:hypothetical protein
VLCCLLSPQGRDTSRKEVQTLTDHLAAARASYASLWAEASQRVATAEGSAGTFAAAWLELVQEKNHLHQATGVVSAVGLLEGTGPWGAGGCCWELTSLPQAPGC